MTQFVTSTASFVPIFQWRGGRPQVVDLEPDQTGWLVCLCLHREGDLNLLPLAWQAQAPDEHHQLTPEERPYPTIYTQALDDTAVSLTLQQLQQDGWHIKGQLTLAFTGRDAIANFEQIYRQYLWQSPKEKG